MSNTSNRVLGNRCDFHRTIIARTSPPILPEVTLGIGLSALPFGAEVPCIRTHKATQSIAAIACSWVFHANDPGLSYRVSTSLHRVRKSDRIDILSKKRQEAIVGLVDFDLQHKKDSLCSNSSSPLWACRAPAVEPNHIIITLPFALGLRRVGI